MKEDSKTANYLINSLKERAKELNCLYQLHKLFNNSDSTIGDICKGIIKIIPPSWQFPDICIAKIVCMGSVYQSEDFNETEWCHSADIKAHDKMSGKIFVYYTKEILVSDEGPFLKEERKLLNTIAHQFGLYIFNKQLEDVFENQNKFKSEQKSEWEVILNLLRRTNYSLLTRISRKMVNRLCWMGITEAEKLLEHFSPIYKENNDLLLEMNRPHQKTPTANIQDLSHSIFEMAGKHLNKNEVLNIIQKWLREDQSSFLVNILENTRSSLEEIISAIERYNHLVQQGLELSTSREMSFRVALIRTFLSDQPLLIDIAKQNVCVNDFNKLIRHLIFPVGGRGKLGGKGSGLFIAKQIITKSEKHNELLANIKTPKTWYISSDNILKFISYNNLEDLVEQKYKEIGQVRQEYPYVVNVFKNSSFPHEIINGLSMALDDFGDKPLVIRSSSQLEDRIGTAFAGKYKSLFIANQGTKEKRLIELMDAIAEVYASTFGPDPIDYRKEQGLLDFHEEMGIMVQEVIGKKVGPYFMPAFAGVAFSQNEFLWSARLKREDGLVRMVPGLGTRAVDRLDNDYPILVAPGSPNFPVNITTDEKIRYSPKNIDVINLKTCRFETIRIEDLLKKHGDEYPAINNIVSILEQDFIRQPGGLGVNFKKDSIVVTFEGLFEKTLFIKRIFAILNELEEKYKYPVDIEFAHDGENFYLLQCRSQSSGKISKPAAIPKNVSRDKIIFSANKYIPNGHVTDISYIVYVDPLMYSELSSHKDMVAIGRAVSRLNQILPKRKFILMGPGRWGSRGDIKLGVNVTYSDINNSSMLIEMARKQKDYVPDLSFGTHFFQDLVESNIRYLPLYPDSRDVTFNEEFFIDSDNILAKILPDYSKYKDVIHVIDVAKTANGDTFQIFMNAELSEAAGVIIKPKMATDLETDKNETSIGLKSQEVHWLWRQRNIEKLAKKIDPVRFGVKAFYLFGSTKNATAGPGSDINILIHFIGNESQRKELLTWLEGWSLSFSQINYLRTGYETDGLLDIHIVTDEDIKNRTSYAVKIGAYTDAARQLAIGKKND